MKNNMVVWFDIPVNDINRAKKFYSKVFKIKFQSVAEDTPNEMAFFPYEKGTVSGALCQGMAKPNHNGSTVYLNAGEDLQEALSRVEEAGGKILQEKMEIGENGFIAFFEDSEGNRVGMHSVN
jgi:predicted enzyme related to lactoylglutathione lyase